jgi:hypothetical protein
MVLLLALRLVTTAGGRTNSDAEQAVKRCNARRNAVRILVRFRRQLVPRFAGRGDPVAGGNLEALADPEHEEHENMLRWRGPFDPESFSLTAVNQQLQKKFHSARKTAAALVSSPPAPKANGVPI